jgi:flagellar basal body-associated protein FliL
MKDLEEMILTLNTKSGETKYCKILITLEFKDEKKIQDVEKLAPLLYDKIIKIADRYYVEELLTDPGKESFRNEIKREFSSILGTNEFNIYFKRFIL